MLGEPGAPAEKARPVVQVDELADNPEKHPGKLVLRGVVSGINESEKVFVVIDSREFESCGLLSCARNYLPVKAIGAIPPPKTIVELTGEVVRGEKGLLFQAERVDSQE